MFAQEEMRRLGHNFIGSEGILLGLIHSGNEISDQVLKSFGVSLKDTRIKVGNIIGRGSS